MRSKDFVIEVLAEARMNSTIFSDVTLCLRVEFYNSEEVTVSTFRVEV
jgi:hypothetical protein